MLYFLLHNKYSTIRAVTREWPGAGERFITRNDLGSFAEATELAAEINSLPETSLAGATYIPTDAGPNCSPRFDVILAPKIGDPISYSFNGDSYPDGEIVKISGSLRIVTSSSGRRYYRRRLTGSWINNNCWSMRAGHHSELNPSF
jgi:hypothetical protein